MRLFLFKEWCITVFFKIPQKPHVLGKLQFVSYGLKCSQPIILQYYLTINISGRNPAISQIFSIQITIKESQYLRLPPLVRCGQLCLLSNQIPGFFVNISGRNPADFQIFCIEIHFLLHKKIFYKKMSLRNDKMLRKSPPSNA